MIKQCSKCGSNMALTVYGWYKCCNEFCFNIYNPEPGMWFELDITLHNGNKTDEIIEGNEIDVLKRILEIIRSPDLRHVLIRKHNYNRSIPQNSS